MEIEIKKDNFEETVLKADKPVVIDFWATWCGPCKYLAPILKKVADTRDDIIVGKCNIDEEPELADQFGIEVIPTLFIIKDGKVAGTKVGFADLAQLNEFIDASI